MPPAVAKAPARKRHRKRKRRAASTSSSSSSSSSSESDSDEEKPLSNTTTIPVKPIQPQEPSESESSSESSLESDSEPEESFLAVPVATSGKLPPKPTQIHHGSPSPSPPPTELPTFLPDNNKGEQDNVAQEQLMKDKFRKFWMASIADGFRDDLEEIRKVHFSYRSTLISLTFGPY